MSVIPAAALSLHTAMLGMTGSGKTNSSKVCIEQVVAEGARVCILDPIKSDWWGITSSADGKSPGLPFHILGGPRGHVPLHSGAGAAIAELVAKGKLRHSIIDMAQFEPGGQVRFFIDFIPVLLREMKGFIYLVMEEAHMFAPKERGGIGNENMSVHWAKMVATAGRSKGVRLIVATQRTQALHNAVLGSCQTLITHKLTAPADQEPVLKWLKAQVQDKATREKVESSLALLSTGEGWICSGEASIFEHRRFPKASTYDNTATPIDDNTEHDVATAPVDQAKLRAIIGEAVKEAEGHDPKQLLARIRELEQQLADGGSTMNDIDVARGEGFEAGKTEGYAHGRAEALRPMVELIASSQGHADELLKNLYAIERGVREGMSAAAASIAVENTEAPAPVKHSGQFAELRMSAYSGHPAPNRQVAKTVNSSVSVPGTPGTITDKAQRAFLTVLAQQRRALTRNQIAIFAGYSSKSGHVDNTISALRSRGYLNGSRDALEITAEGRKALGKYTPLPTGAELRAYWIRQLEKAAASFLDVICAVYPKTITRDQVAERAGYSTASGHVDNTLSQLRSRELITGPRDALRASEELFG